MPDGLETVGDVPAVIQIHLYRKEVQNPTEGWIRPATGVTVGFGNGTSHHFGTIYDTDRPDGPVWADIAAVVAEGIRRLHQHPEDRA